MGFQRRDAGLGLAIVLVLLMTGCGIGDIRRPVPTEPPTPRPSTPVPVRTPIGPDEVRRADVPVPGDFEQNHVEFVDAKHGYALFTRCDRAHPVGWPPVPDCAAIVLSTADGGRSWQQLHHPRPMAKNHQMYAATGGHILLLAEPHGWYVSTDSGRTFRHEPPAPEMPAAYRHLFNRFQLSEGSTVVGGSGQVVEWVGDRARPVPAQPPVPGLSTVAYANGLLFAAGVRDGRPYAAFSPDEGKTWRQTAVPAGDGELSMLRVVLSSDGSDAWLVGFVGDLVTFPHLWHLAGRRWEPVEAAGHPPRIGGLAAIGFGMLAVTGPSGSGVIAGDNYHDLGWPLGGDDLRTLDDGTLFSVHPDDSVWLGAGWGWGPRWTKIVLTKM